MRARGAILLSSLAVLLGVLLRRRPVADPHTVSSMDDLPLLGAALMAGTANVIMQLARPGVGYGVMESPVESGRIFDHPIKRTRTTLTYIAVALRGTDEERRAYRRAVNGSHAQVRSGPDSTVPYDAFDPQLQLWVAACLYRGVEDTYRALVGELDDHTQRVLYRDSAKLGTTLQVPAELWPTDRDAFEDYWRRALDEVHIDDAVRTYLRSLVSVGMVPEPVRPPLARLHRFLTTGFLPPRFREEMQLPWTPRQQRRFDRFTRFVGVVVHRLPRPLQEWPFNHCLADFRWRLRTGRPLV